MQPSSFSHEAMNTTFQVVLAGSPEPYARQAAAAAFRELDRLELELSRFVEGSDIARINRLGRGESTRLGEDCLHCLLEAMQVSALTGRAFDPAYLTVRPAGEADAPLFGIDPGAHQLTSFATRLTLDLGAVGKGYALDRLREVLAEWDIPGGFLQSGGSSVLGFGQAEWPVNVGERNVRLANQAVSASGLEVQGSHIVDPRRNETARRTRRVWSFASSAATSDALSTAFFVMSDGEIAAFCSAHPEFGAAIQQPDGTVRSFGRTPEFSGPSNLPE